MGHNLVHVNILKNVRVQMHVVEYCMTETWAKNMQNSALFIWKLNCHLKTARICVKIAFWCCIQLLLVSVP